MRAALLFLLLCFRPLQADTPPPGIPALPVPDTMTVASVYGDANFYTHWVDNTHVSATDSSNPNGSPATPRMTLPSMSALAAGSVIQVRGGPYTAGGTSPWTIGGSGSEAQPIFFRGGSSASKVELQRGFRIENGTWIIFENIKQTGQYTQVDARPTSGAQSVHHIWFRDCEIDGTGVYQQSAGIAFSGVSASVVTDCGVIRCTLTDIDDWQTVDHEPDQHALRIAGYSERIWYGWNTIARIGGDGVGNGHDANYTAKNYYIFSNTITDCHENTIDVKELDHVRIAYNDLSGCTGRPTDPGSVLVLHYGPDDSFTNGFVWANKIHNGRFGIALSDTENVWIFGNWIYDIGWNRGPLPGSEPTWTSVFAAGACIQGNGNNGLRIFNNTFSDYDTGLLFADAAAMTSIEINNNIFANRNVATAFEMNFDSTTANVTNYNFYDASITPRIRYNATLYNNATYGGAVAGNEVNSLTGAADFVNAGTWDLSLQSSSDAIGVGSEYSGYATLATLFGVSVAVDIAQQTRPQDTTWDIGADEYTAGGGGGGSSLTTGNLNITGNLTVGP